jgi:hypothetical protein
MIAIRINSWWSNRKNIILLKSMIMEKWKSTPGDMPIEATDCWVRLNYWFGQPFKAQWSDLLSGWTDIVSGMFYPVWAISRWKYVV